MLKRYLPILLLALFLMFSSLGMWWLTGKAAPITGGVTTQQIKVRESVTQGPSGAISLEGSGFYYPADFPARYQQAKSLWRNSHPAEKPSVEELRLFALQAYSPDSDLLRPFREWRLAGGPNPWMFRPVLYVANKSQDEALLSVHVRAVLEIELGQYYVDPTTYLTNLKHLKNTARWEVLREEVATIEALSPQEETLKPLPPVDLLAELIRRPNQWPTRMRLKTCPVKSPTAKACDGRESSVLLPFYPDHFSLPLSLY